MSWPPDPGPSVLAHLDFAQPGPGPSGPAPVVDIEFGAGGAGGEANITVSGVFGFGGTVLANVDAGIYRGLTQRVALPHQDAAPLAMCAALPWQPTAPLPVCVPLPIETAAPLSAQTAAPWGSTEAAQGRAALPWQAAPTSSGQTTALWAQAAVQRLLTRVAYQMAAAAGDVATLLWQEGEYTRHFADLPWQQAQALRPWARLPFGQQAKNARIHFTAPWQQAQTLRTCRSGPVYVRPAPPVPPVPAEVVNLRFCALYSADGPWPGGFAPDAVPVVFGVGCDTLPPALIVVPIRSIYMIHNELTLRRVLGNIPIPASAFSMSIDAQSFTWRWSATVEASAFAVLAPQAGQPTEIEATVNGVAYRLMVEDVSRSRSFNSSRLDVGGRGLAAELDSPYAREMTFGNPVADFTAQQLTEAALTINGASLGWAVDWGITDWLVPTGAWSHQGTHLSAARAIVGAAGGYLQPHRTARTLRVLPQYPAAPWAWDALTPHFELPTAPVTTEGIQWLTKPAYNRAHVSGQNLGVLGVVTRAGTAGDLPAPMVTDPLITHADAARQRGLSILGDTGRQALVTLSLPVLPETGLIEPGAFVRYVDGPTVRMGLVRSSALNWSRPRLRQTLALETHLD